VCECASEGKNKGEFISIEIRGDGSPVVIREKDLTFILNRIER
jgi:hypothetical protein